MAFRLPGFKSLLPVLPVSPRLCSALPPDQVALEAHGRHVLPSVSFPTPTPEPDSRPLTAGGGAEAGGASPSITQREKPQIRLSLSAPVMLKGKRATVVVQGHSSLLTAVLAQDSPSDESVVCSAASPDQGWGQGRAAADWQKFTAKFSLDTLCWGRDKEVLLWMPAKGGAAPVGGIGTIPQQCRPIATRGTRAPSGRVWITAQLPPPAQHRPRPPGAPRAMLLC